MGKFGLGEGVSIEVLGVEDICDFRRLVEEVALNIFREMFPRVLQGACDDVIMSDIWMSSLRFVEIVFCMCEKAWSSERFLCIGKS